MELGENLKTMRKKAKMTQMELAQKADIAINSVRLYEAGKATPSIEMLAKIAKALDVRPGELLGAEWVALDTLEKGQKSGWKDGTAEFLDAEILEKRMEKAYYSLNFNGKQVAVERIEELAQLPQYQNAAGDSTQSADDEPAE